MRKDKKKTKRVSCITNCHMILPSFICMCLNELHGLNILFWLINFLRGVVGGGELNSRIYNYSGIQSACIFFILCLMCFLSWNPTCTFSKTFSIVLSFFLQTSLLHVAFRILLVQRKKIQANQNDHRLFLKCFFSSAACLCYYSFKRSMTKEKLYLAARVLF